MTPGIGERLKKMAKRTGDVERTLQDAEAVLQGRRPLSSISRPSSHGSAPPGISSAPAPPAANLRCAYCGNPVAQGSPKCPNCNAPI